jgi:MFS family permease
MAQAGLVPSVGKALASWFPPTRRAFASGMVGSAMAAGSALAPRLTGRLLREFDWRSLFTIYMIPGLVWSVLFLFTVPGRPSGAPAGPASVQPLRRMFASVPFCLLCAQQFFRAAAMAFFLYWLPTFLARTRNLETETAGELASNIGVGALFGSIAGGICSDVLLHVTGSRRLSRQGLAVFGLGSCSGLIIVAYYIANLDQAIAIMTLAAFVATFGGVSGYTVAIELGGKSVATVFSVMNMCGNIGAAIYPWAAGEIVGAMKQQGDEQLGWRIMLFLAAGIFAVDAICWALLNPKKNLDGEPL